jgi:hypothetical protein
MIEKACDRPSYQGSAFAYWGRGSLSSPVLGSRVRSSKPNLPTRRTDSSASNSSASARNVIRLSGRTEIVQRQGPECPSVVVTQSPSNPFDRSQHRDPSIAKPARRAT